MRPKDYLELTRPFTLIAPAVGVIAGSSIASGAIPDSRTYIAALSASFLNAASNVNNQYFDADIDRLNKPFRPIPSARVSARSALYFGLALYAAALFLSRLVALRFFGIVVLASAITFFYSAPPLRFKKHPFFSNAAIAFVRGMLLIVAGWSISRTVFSPEPWFIGLIFALYLLGAAATKDFSDMPGDARGGIRTLPLVYGPEKAAQIISPFFYLPFLLIPLGVAAGIIRPAALPLTALSLWGFYAARLITRNPKQLALEKNHVSWKHMYLILITGQLGFAAAYLISP